MACIVIRWRASLDASALFAAVLAPESGARTVLRLGEMGLVSLWVGRRVLSVADAVVTGPAPATRRELALLLKTAGVQIGPEPDAVTLARLALTENAHDYDPVPSSLGDPVMREPGYTLGSASEYTLAEALMAGVGYFISLDERYLRRDFAARAWPFRLCTPATFLEILRADLDQDEAGMSEMGIGAVL
jgi:hypothetical protein